ncbi:hypothetical protein HPB50_000360 [Hyalomma asiaticum]|uniref:Uncharacterized protein n=1 Tax=Hyalomma asiaticum TaxID=266040 RepID=A0ACB7SCF6_HYAAI|nr:hypothetical protein HPB50_000360 [Hyalomma asiaticum]
MWLKGGEEKMDCSVNFATSSDSECDAPAAGNPHGQSVEDMRDEAEESENTGQAVELENMQEKAKEPDSPGQAVEVDNAQEKTGKGCAIKLPVVKSRGRPSKRIHQRKIRTKREEEGPVPFKDLSPKSQEKLLLTGIAGQEAAARVLNEEGVLDESDIEVRPEELPSALLDHRVPLTKLKKYFTAEAWLLLSSSRDPSRFPLHPDYVPSVFTHKATVRDGADAQFETAQNRKQSADFTDMEGKGRMHFPKKTFSPESSECDNEPESPIKTKSKTKTPNGPESHLLRLLERKKENIRRLAKEKDDHGPPSKKQHKGGMDKCYRDRLERQGIPAGVVPLAVKQMNHYIVGKLGDIEKLAKWVISNLDIEPDNADMRHDLLSLLPSSRNGRDSPAVRVNTRCNIVAADLRTKACLQELLAITELRGVLVAAWVPADKTSSTRFLHSIHEDVTDAELLWVQPQSTATRIPKPATDSNLPKACVQQSKSQGSYSSTSCITTGCPCYSLKIACISGAHSVGTLR